MKTLSFHDVEIGRSPKKVLLKIDSDTDSVSIQSGLNLFVAPNGYGKSTLFQSIAGSLGVLNGKIRLDGELFQPEKDVIYVSEYLSFPKFVYPSEWIQFFSENSSKEMPSEWIKGFRYEDKMKSFIGRMSQGERRKLTWLATWQSTRPVLLFDEPLDGLDLLAVEAARKMIQEWKQQGRILCIVTHQVGDLLNLADEVFLLKDQRLLRSQDCFSGQVSDMGADRFRDEVLQIYSP